MAALTDNMRGAVLMMGAMLAFLINDTCMKALADELPLMQAIAIRGTATTILLGGWALATRALKLDLSRRDWWLVLVRTVAEIAAAYYFISAIFNMPIANATAIFQALPLAVTLAAALFLGEKVGWRRFTAIGIGFLGVMLIVRPGPEGFNIYAIYALISVVAVVVRDLSTRRLSASVPSMTVALSAAAGVALFGILGSLGGEWAAVSQKAGMQLAGSVCFVIIGYFLSIMAMRVGEIGFVAPFRYTGLIFALIAGLIIFGEFPDPITLLGCFIVVATGLFTFYRERRVGRQVETGPAPLRIR